MKTVYLAGPITGKTYGEAKDWREYAIRRLYKHGVIGLSPLRGKGYLREFGRLDNGGRGSAYANQGKWPLSSAKGIVLRDRNDVRTCDAVLANLVGADAVSIGTVMEIAWADAFRTPCVIAMELGGEYPTDDTAGKIYDEAQRQWINPHQHAMIEAAGGLIVPDLETALWSVLTIVGASIEEAEF